MTAPASRLFTDEAAFRWQWRHWTRHNADRAALMVQAGAHTAESAFDELLGMTRVRLAVLWRGEGAPWLPTLLGDMLDERAGILDAIGERLFWPVRNGATEDWLRRAARGLNGGVFDDPALQAGLRAIVGDILATRRRRGAVRAR